VTSTTTRVAIIGASGYAARELFRMLRNHPLAHVSIATSRQDESTRVATLHPSLYGRTDLTCVAFDADRVAESASYAFLALPHTASMEIVPSLRARGVRVIDLSADYRLTNPQIYADWYNHPHTDPEGLATAVYGLPELYRDKIPGTDLIANPGCYTSASILGLAPLIAENLIDRKTIIIDAKSGVSGAGRAPKLNTHYPECNESLSAYSVGQHRHTPEIDQILTDVTGGKGDSVEVIFTPHLVPMDRGIHATIYAVPISPHTPSEHELMDLYRSYYSTSPFVRIVSHLPGTKDSNHTNFCDITIRVVRGRIVIISCLDNLIKGAAGVAIQNLNLMIDCVEETALL
jgi:N-acetyl-gamma-glutamyl-phosphate reductase